MANILQEMWNEHRKDSLKEVLNQNVSTLDMMKKGGDHLGTIRDWIQRKCVNGENVTWGSQDPIKTYGNLTVKDLEVLACEIAAAAVNDYRKEIVTKGAIKFLENSGGESK